MAQLSLSLMMLTAAGLFIHSAVRAADVEPGFAMDHELLAEVDASLIDYDETRGSQLYANLKDRLRQVPGVQSVAIAATVPFGMFQLGKGILSSDTAVSKDHPALSARYNVVSEDYFKVMEIPILRGRAFSQDESTRGSKTNVAILDRRAADKLWPGRDPLGRHIRIDGGEAQDLEVIGVVGDIRENIIGEGIEPHLYIPLGREYHSDVQFHLRHAGGGTDAETRALEAVRREILAADARLPLLALKTMRGHLESGDELWVVRTGAHILEIFGAVALLLAAIGLYALNAYTVARRTREIGIRMALGADVASTLRMILGESLRVTMIGIGAGLLLAAGVGRALAGFLYDLPNLDPLVLVAAPGLLALVALIACYVPARRAAQVDPLIALRYE